jgi:hypothetical protein
LDWGLGHATRCIPIIKELLQQKCEIWIATSGDQKALLKEEFPFLSFVELPGYSVEYGKNRAFTLLKIVSSIPKILIRIKREKDWLRRFLATEKPDVVISDNRYGLYAPGLYSIFITHQLRIRTPFGSFADTLLQRIHYRAIRRFSSCWIPDLEGAGSLAGELSHPAQLPSVPTRYIGLLSRFERPAASSDSHRSAPISDIERPMPITDSERCDLLILLSGPEPQRTIFERKILDQLPSYSGSKILVRGLPGPGIPPVLPDGSRGVRVYNHLPAQALNALISGAGIVLSRAGYSTIMDLLKLGKKAILVPTPGQTEQEYLGRYLSGKGLALCVEQSTFSLSGAMDKARSFPFMGIGAGLGGQPARKPSAGDAPGDGNVLPDGDTLLQKAIRDLLSSYSLLG